MQTQCPDCGSSRLVLCSDGDEVCTNCGLVVNDCRIQETAEYRNYDDGVDRNHYGSGPTLKDIAADKPRLGTTEPKTAPRTFGSSNCDQALDKNLTEMRTKMTLLRVNPFHQQRAEASFVKDWNARRGKRGADKNCVMAACLYAATDNMMSVDEIMARFGITHKKKFSEGQQQLKANGAVPSPKGIHENNVMKANKYVADIQGLMPGLTSKEKIQVGGACLRIDDMMVQQGVRGSKNTYIYNKAVVLVALEQSGRSVDREMLSANANLNSVDTIIHHQKEIRECLRKEGAQPPPGAA